MMIPPSAAPRFDPRAGAPPPAVAVRGPSFGAGLRRGAGRAGAGRLSSGPWECAAAGRGKAGDRRWPSDPRWPVCAGCSRAPGASARSQPNRSGRPSTRSARCGHRSRPSAASRSAAAAVCRAAARCAVYPAAVRRPRWLAVPRLDLRASAAALPRPARCPRGAALGPAVVSWDRCAVTLAFPFPSTEPASAGRWAVTRL